MDEKKFKNYQSDKMDKKIILKEKVNKEICDKLLFMSFSDFLKCREMLGKTNKDDDIKGLYNLLHKTMTDFYKNDYEVERTYKNSENNKYGRLFVEKRGLQTVFSSFRGLLCENIYRDFDMANCHPTILKYLCKKDGVSCYRLEDYLSNREQKIDELMSDYNLTKKESKMMFLTAINKNETTNFIKGKKLKNGFFNDFCKEMIKIQNHFSEKNFKLAKEISKRVKYNINGKVLNVLLCKCENDILMKVLTKRRVSVMCFDGYLEEITEESDDEVIEELNEITKEYGIKWTHKEHDLSLKNFVLSLEKSDVSFCGDNVNDIAVFLLDNFFKGKIVKDESKVFIFDNDRNIWINNEKSGREYLYNAIRKMDLWIVDKKCVDSYRVLLDIVSILINMSPFQDGFVDSVISKFEFKLCFNNGYLDLKTSKFNEYSEDNRPFVKIDRDFNVESNEKVRDEIYKKVFNPIFTISKFKERKQLLEYFLYELSQVIGGDSTNKKWFLMRGLRDCGKGCIGEFIRNTFKNYIGIVNAGNFINKNVDSTDEAKSLSWLLSSRKHRLLICDEISLKPKQTFNDGLIKKIRSGGTGVQCRLNYGDEVVIQVNTSLMFCVNEFLEVKKDTKETCIDIYFKSKFLEPEDEEDELEGYEFFLKDDSIKKFIKEELVVNEFVHIILEFFNRKDIKKIEVDDIEDDKEDDFKKIKRIFDYNAESYITTKDLNIILQNEGIISKREFKEKIRGVFSKVDFKRTKKINGVSTKVVLGLQHLDNEFLTGITL